MKKEYRRIIRKMMRSSFLIGMASVFCPSVIHVDSVHVDSASDLQNIGDDWKQVGSYISKAYDAARK